VRCTLFGIDTGNVKHFLAGNAFQINEKMLSPRGETVEKRASPAAILRAGCHWRRCPLVFVSKVDPAFAQIVGSHFDRDSIASKDTDSVFLHPPGRIGKSFMPIVQLYAKPCVRKQFLYSSLKLDQVFFSQTDLLD
jgi:hypothetical protein